QSISMILASFTSTNILIAFSAFSVTATVHFEAFNIFTQTSSCRLYLFLLIQEFIFKFNAIYTAKTNHTKLVWIQKTATMFSITLLQGAVTLMDEFLAALTLIVYLLRDNFLFFVY